MQNTARVLGYLAAWIGLAAVAYLFYAVNNNEPRLTAQEGGGIVVFFLSAFLVFATGWFVESPSFGEEYGKNILEKLGVDPNAQPRYAVEHSWETLRVQAEAVLYAKASLVKDLQRRIPITDDPFDSFYIAAKDAAAWAKEDFEEVIQFFFERDLVNSTKYDKYFNVSVIG